MAHDLASITQLISLKRWTDASHALTAFKPNHSKERADYLNLCLSIIQRLSQTSPLDTQLLTVLATVSSLAFRLNPNQHEIGLYWVNTLVDLQLLNPALAASEEVLLHHPNWPQAWNERAFILLGLEQWEEAYSSAQKALALNSGYLEALGNAATACLKLNRWEQAVSHLDQLLSQAPNHPIALRRSIFARVPLGRYEDIIALSHQLKKTAHYTATDESNLIWAMVQAGQFHQAVQTATPYLAQHPKDVDAWLNTGNAWYGLSEPIHALKAYESGLLVAPAHTGLCIAKALTLKMLGDLKGARQIADRLVESLPNHPESLCLLGSVQCDLGEFSEALPLFERALNDQPHCIEALIGITRSRTMRKTDDTWLGHARSCLSTNISAPQKATLWHAIGKFHDDRHEYEEAFFAHKQGNELITSYGYGYDRQKELDRCQNRISFFTSQKIETLSEQGNLSSKPIFIVGMPRSGTSLLEQILSSHSTIFGAGELVYWNFVSDIFDRERDPNIIESYAQDYLELLQTHSAQPHVVDKLPANFENIGLMHVCFPNAKFLHITRHPLDVALSIYFQGFSTAHRYAHQLADIGHYFELYRQYMHHWASVCPESIILEISYEALVLNPAAEIARVCAFLEIEMEPSMLESHRHQRPVLTASGWQVRQPIHQRAQARFKHYEKHLNPLSYLTSLTV